MADIGARVYHNAVQSVNNGAWTAVVFNSERYDTDGIHSVVLNTGRLTCQTAGTYNITGHCRWASNLVGDRGIRVRLDGATIIAGYDVNATGVSQESIDTIYKLAAGQYAELLVYQASGAPLNLSVSGNDSPEFAMQLMAVT